MELTSTEKKVLDAFLSLSGPLYVSVTVEEIQAATGLSRNTVANTLAKLRTKRLVAVRDGGGDAIPARYVLGTKAAELLWKERARKYGINE